MATLTRSLPAFQVEDVEPEERRPLHLDIPTPFPRLYESSSSRDSSSDHKTEELPPSSGETTSEGVQAEVVVSQVEQDADIVSGHPIGGTDFALTPYRTSLHPR